MKMRSYNFCHTNTKNPGNNLGIFCLITGRPKLNGYVYLGVLLSSEGEIAEMALIPSGQMGIWHTKKGPDQIGSFVGMEMTGRIHRHLPK